jgi:L-glyceraldehyde 3-phosphate reductase
VEGEEMVRALQRTGASVVASSRRRALAGGALTGKYAHGGSGRLSGANERHLLGEIAHPADRLASLARAWRTSAADLAIALTLPKSRVGSVLFGSTTPQQVHENCAAIDVVARLTDDQLAQLGSIGAR